MAIDSCATWSRSPAIARGSPPEAERCSASSQPASRRHRAAAASKRTAPPRHTRPCRARGVRQSEEAVTLAASSGPRAADLRERPVAELLKQLANETTTLVRQELDLAKAEMREKAGRAGAGAGMWGAAGVIALIALGSLTAFLILALDGVMPNWLAALIVGLAYAAIAGVLYLRGKQRVEEAGSPVPEQTVETLKQDVQWAKHPTTSAKT